MGRQVDRSRPAATWCRVRQAGCSITSGAARCNLSRVKALVLDEADEMLSMGFLEDITEILKRCPPERQTLLFSATMPDDVLRLASRYLRRRSIQLSARASQPPRLSTPTTWSPAWAGCATCSASSRSSGPTQRDHLLQHPRRDFAVAEFLRNQGQTPSPSQSTCPSPTASG
jgi:hypothetical protein